MSPALHALSTAVFLLFLSSLSGATPITRAEKDSRDSPNRARPEPAPVGAPMIWRNLPIGGGGYVTGLVHHPVVPGVTYIRTDVGGAYRLDPQAEGSGLRWTPLLDFLPFEREPWYSVDGMALDPVDPDLLYLAVGHSLRERGALLFSQDRGRTFIDAGLEAPFLGNGPRRWCGERIAVDPSDRSKVWVGTRTLGLWVGRREGGAFVWERSPGIPDSVAHLHTIVFASPTQTAPETWMACAGPDHAAFLSRDGGRTWADIGGPRGPYALAFEGRSGLWATSPTGVHRYDFETGEWEDRSPKAGIEYGGLALHPRDASLVAVTENRRGHQAPIWISRRAGRNGTWREVSMAAGTVSTTNAVGWHPAIWFASAPAALRFHPLSEATLWLTDWYTVWVADDLTAERVEFRAVPWGHEELVNLDLACPPPGGSGALVYSGHADVGGFVHRPDEGFPAESFRDHAPNRLLVEVTGIAPVEMNPDAVWVLGANCWQDGHHGEIQRGGLFYSADQGRTMVRSEGYQETWKWGRVAVSPKGTGLVVVTQAGGVRWSSDGGRTFAPAERAPSSADAGVRGHIFNRFHPVAGDLVEEGRFYLVSARADLLFESRDGGRSWEPIVTISAPRKAEGGEYADASVVRSAASIWVRPLPGRAGQLWVAHEGTLWRIDANARLTQQIVELKDVQTIAVGAGRADGVAIYAFARRRGGAYYLFRSLDDGVSWERVNDDMQQLGKTLRLAADRRSFGRLFVGTGGRGVLVGEPVSP